jgi:hypothetical protein
VSMELRSGNALIQVKACERNSTQDDEVRLIVLRCRH